MQWKRFDNIRNYEDVDGTSAMQNGEDQCCLYIAEKDQFLAGNVAMPSNVNAVCKRRRTKASGRDCCNAKFVSNPVAYISLWLGASAIRSTYK